MRWVVTSRALLIAAMLIATGTGANAGNSGWHSLQVPGGRETLSALGVGDAAERGTAAIALIRRLHFATDPPTQLIDAVRQLQAALPDGPSITLPSPLPAALWSEEVFRRPIPEPRLFAEIMNDAAARLLFHGLSGMDATARAWIAGEPRVLRRLYQRETAVRSFALFAPAVVIRDGHVVIPGGETGTQRWSRVLGARPEHPGEFIAALFEHNDGRTAGLYFVLAESAPDRQRFILGAADRRFIALVRDFARCYPRHSNTDYPFLVRSHDAALLLLDVGVDGEGRLRGPRDAALWKAVLGLDDSEGLDAASMTGVLCRAAPDDRRAVFETILAAQRVFGANDASSRGDMIVALRGRRDYPALFMAVEQAGVVRPEIYAALVRHADGVTAVSHPGRAITAARLFQGAVALTIKARRSGTFTPEQAEALLTTLAAVPLNDGHYDGGVAVWLEKWLSVVRDAHPGAATLTAEQTTAFALAGPPTSTDARIEWEGDAYVLDVRGTIERRLLDVRQLQNGITLDTVLALNAATAPSSATAADLAITPADEYEGDGPLPLQWRRERKLRIVDYLLAHALASWAYAPHVGDAGGGAMIAGDGSLRHQLGVQLGGRARREQRWQVASSPMRGVVAGSLLALEAPLASWSLRRLSVAAMPPQRQIGGNDLMSLMLTVALADARRLNDGQRDTIAAAVARGVARIDGARSDPEALIAIAADTGISPWRRAVLPWMVEHEPDAVTGQFSLTATARAGGLADAGLAPWGTANIVRGCLCVDFPARRIPELMLGRAADGIVGAQSTDLMIRIATILAEMRMPGQLAAAVLPYAMRDFLDRVQPRHFADVDAFERQARALARRDVEDYLSAIATVGPLRPVSR